VLIWVRGEIVPEEALAVPAGDRVFEHGVGLFETLRTFGGAAPLLPRHLARMNRSAAALGLPLDRIALPDAGAISRLVEANRGPGDAVIRITLSGGTIGGGEALVWMRLASLPPPPPATGAVVDCAAWTLDRADPLARHKTLNYWARRLAYEHGQARGADEVLFATPDGSFWEGSRMNLFLVSEGILRTPGLDGPVLPGIMRALILELAPDLGLMPAAAERGLSEAELAAADEVFLTNSVRGVVPVGRLTDHRWPAPGSWTSRLRDRVDEWLSQRGSDQ
jgi:branched-subunit amino acid aminotransferase/4-amino-4-deoxychorismate lyase